MKGNIKLFPSYLKRLHLSNELDEVAEKSPTTKIKGNMTMQS
jgi:hypothetical protein